MSQCQQNSRIMLCNDQNMLNNDTQNLKLQYVRCVGVCVVSSVTDVRVYLSGGTVSGGLCCCWWRNRRSSVGGVSSARSERTCASRAAVVWWGLNSVGMRFKEQVLCTGRSHLCKEGAPERLLGSHTPVLMTSATFHSIHFVFTPLNTFLIDVNSCTAYFIEQKFLSGNAFCHTVIMKWCPSPSSQLNIFMLTDIQPHKTKKHLTK